MLAVSAFFAYKVYEHIQTLQDPKEADDGVYSDFNLDAMLQEADDAMQGGDFQKALAIYSEVNFKQKDDVEVLFKMGYALEQQNRDDEALEYYKDALKLDENNLFVLQATASLYRKMGEYASARNYLNRLIDIDANNPITYYNYGNLLVDMKEYVTAKEMYKKAFELDENFTEARREYENLRDI